MTMILVTGAYGFIGMYLVDELLRQGHEVLATGHRSAAARYFEQRAIPYLNLDITREEDFGNLPKDGIDAVIHLAGLLPANVKACPPQDYIRINVLGTLNLLEYCRTHGVRKVLSTTSYADILNAWSVEPPTSSETPRDFRLTGDHAMYVVSKNAATDAMLHYNAAYGFQNSIFRLPPVYGYGPHLTIYVDGKSNKSGFQIFMEKAESGEPIEIWGDPSAVRDVVYVKDVVQAFVKALHSDAAQGVYNIASGAGITLLEQAQAMVDVRSAQGRRPEIVLRPDKPNSLKPYVLDISRAQRDFGYRPAYSFHDMIVDYAREELAGTYAEFIENRKCV
jgi:UDP-glucose 4-epimerase